MTPESIGIFIAGGTLGIWLGIILAVVNQRHPRAVERGIQGLYISVMITVSVLVLYLVGSL